MLRKIHQISSSLGFTTRNYKYKVGNGFKIIFNLITQFLYLISICLIKYIPDYSLTLEQSQNNLNYLLSQ